MRGIIFTVLTLIVGGLIALGFEWLAAFLPGQMSGALLKVYSIGIHPLSAHINICGALGLILGYIIISKFVKK